jgi:hypothetical protein
MVISFITIANQIQESYRDLNLGLATKARAWKSANQECDLGVTFTSGNARECEGMSPHTGNENILPKDVKILSLGK